MRKSLSDLYGVKKDNYPGIPEELKRFNYYLSDSGHSIMAIPECLLKEAEDDGDLYMYECAFPCKYVLEKGYRIYKDHVICEAEYDTMLGLIIDEMYTEY